MPETRATVTQERTSSVAHVVAAVRRRLLIVAGMQALTAGLLLATAIAIAASSLWGYRPAVWLVAGVAGVTLAAGITVRAWRRLTPLLVATTIERGAPTLDNLLVTTIELQQQARTAHPIVLHELERQTEARIQSVVPAKLAPLAGPVILAAIVAVGAVVALVSIDTGARMPIADDGVVETAVAPGESGQHQTLRVTVTPPAYTGRPAQTVQDAAEVEVLEGSRVRLEIGAVEATVQLIEVGHPATTLEKAGTSWSTELIAERTRFLLLRTTEAQGAQTERLLALLVKPDGAPIVRIRQPARDLLFAEPRGRVPVEIEATDDLGLGALSLRYTRVFGSGENVQFQEGDLPVRIEKSEPGRWRATGEISLEGLQLADGDTLVYRATTRDLRPGRDPSASESYLLEVGKLAQAASAGFALPEDKDRQALSQQMLIVKTERLHNERDRMPREAYEERARALAIEQRMVRAEFVFMTGGEVEDEVAEAEQSHEVVEGRFQNEGQVELLTAIREMSRAEARLNDVATGPALELERLALKALQRAFDRRRYLLRTMPERARIDQTRRLTGELASARSWRRGRAASPDDAAVKPLIELAQALAAAKQSGASLAALAARVGALEPESTELQKAALALAASAASDSTRATAIDDTIRLLADRARRVLTSARAWMPHDTAAGRYADAVAAGTSRR